MTIVGWAQIVLVLAAVIAAAVPLGAYIAHVLAGERTIFSRVLIPVERAFYKLSGVDPAREQSWAVYASAMLSRGKLGCRAARALALHGPHATGDDLNYDERETELPPHRRA